MPLSKVLGVDDGSNSGTDVAAVVDDNVTVTGANADSGGTGGVCCTNHAFAAGSQDQVDFLHQQSGQIQGGFFIEEIMRWGRPAASAASFMI